MITGLLTISSYLKCQRLNLLTIYDLWKSLSIQHTVLFANLFTNLEHQCPQRLQLSTVDTLSIWKLTSTILFWIYLPSQFILTNLPNTVWSTYGYSFSRMFQCFWLKFYTASSNVLKSFGSIECLACSFA